MKRTHGETQHVDGKRVASAEYRSWQMMRNRCLNPKAEDYSYYGGRGISIDSRWSSFEVFLADMGRRPTPMHTLDREDGDKDYGPSNCSWATRRTQSRNRKYCVPLTFRGVTLHTWEWAERRGVKAMTFHHYRWRIKAGLLSEAEFEEWLFKEKT